MTVIVSVVGWSTVDRIEGGVRRYINPSLSLTSVVYTRTFGFQISKSILADDSCGKQGASEKR
jgi:hypothetical protein